MLAMPRTAWNKRGSRGEDPSGLLQLHGYCRGSKEGSAAGLPRMHAKHVSSQWDVAKRNWNHQSQGPGNLPPSGGSCSFLIWRILVLEK